MYQIKKKDGWVRISDQKIIEQHILERNEIHFGQASNTPFANGELINLFGCKGINENSTDLIDKGIIPVFCNQPRKCIYSTIDRKFK
jgi:hypothetical protein